MSAQDRPRLNPMKVAVGTEARIVGSVPYEPLDPLIERLQLEFTKLNTLLGERTGERDGALLERDKERARRAVLEEKLDRERKLREQAEEDTREVRAVNRELIGRASRAEEQLEQTSKTLAEAHAIQDQMRADRDNEYIRTAQLERQVKALEETTPTQAALKAAEEAAECAETLLERCRRVAAHLDAWAGD